MSSTASTSLLFTGTLVALATGCGEPTLTGTRSPGTPSVDPSPAATTPGASPTPAGAVPRLREVGRPRGPIDVEAVAIAAFREAWDEEVVPTTSRDRLVAEWSEAARSRPLHAERGPCVNGHRRVDGTLSAEERQRLVLFGTIPALDKDGTCWMVRVWRGGFETIMGYLDASTGSLLLVWLVPEG